MENEAGPPILSRSGADVDKTSRAHRGLCVSSVSTYIFFLSTWLLRIYELGRIGGRFGYMTLN